ncbi:hypothetical protein [Halocatena halophila]
MTGETPRSSERTRPTGASHTSLTSSIAVGKPERVTRAMANELGI